MSNVTAKTADFLRDHNCITDDAGSRTFTPSSMLWNYTYNIKQDFTTSDSRVARYANSSSTVYDFFKSEEEALEWCVNHWHENHAVSNKLGALKEELKNLEWDVQRQAGDTFWNIQDYSDIGCDDVYYFVKSVKPYLKRIKKLKKKIATMEKIKA